MARLFLIALLLSSCTHHYTSDKPWTEENIAKSIENAQKAQENKL